MSNWLSKLKVFPYKKLNTLQKENEELKNKLSEKQDIINKTNAYWKRELRKARGQKVAPRPL